MNKKVLGIGIGVLILISLSFISAHTDDSHEHYMMGGMMGGGMGQADGMMGNMLGLSSAMGLGGGGLRVFWIFVVVGIVWFVSWINRKQDVASSSKTDLDVLKERYAKGEIGREEFETKKKDIA